MVRWAACGCATIAVALAGGHDFFPGNYSKSGVIGRTLPGEWQAFADESPWNTPIPDDARVHPANAQIMSTVVGEAKSLRFTNRFMPALWVVNSDNMSFHVAQSPYPFDAWDTNLDGRTEAGVPLDPKMWGEATRDGHIIIVDPFKMLAWEMSRFTGLSDGVINCSTFNVWDLLGSGAGNPDEGTRWRARGGRGSGFPIIGGLIRPEELATGEIAHALVFTFTAAKNASGAFVPPAARNDGRGEAGLREGTLLQLDPALTDIEFTAWGLTEEGKVVARCLQRYGMYDGDNGGAMALQLQLLDPDPAEHRRKWDALFPGFYTTINRIPTDKFRVIATGPPVQGGAASVVVQPLIQPFGGKFVGRQTVTMQTATAGAWITYTSDGSEPTVSATRYEKAFQISASGTIKARAFKKGMTESSVTRMPFWKMGDSAAVDHE